MLPSRHRYKWFYDHVHSRYYNLLVKWCFLPFGGERTCRGKLLGPVELSTNDKILDLCCGTGGSTSAILRKAARSCRIVGLDLSIGQLRIARQHAELGHVQFVEGDAAHLPFSDGAFDEVFIAHAIHEMPREIRLATLGEARRVLK